MSIELIKVESVKDAWFDLSWDLYCEAFPVDERRSYASMKRFLEYPAYYPEIILFEGKFAGIVFWWLFDKMLFIEHFATLPSVRGKGIGALVIDKIQKQYKTKPIILEVEHPAGELEQRRVNFYKRLGFFENDFEYTQPPLDKGQKSLDLMLMSYPNVMTQSELMGFVQQYTRYIKC